VEKRGGKLLTTEYINQHKKLDVICEKGHLWHPSGEALRKDRWCSFCRGSRISKSKIDPNKIYKIKQVAKERGGECLSDIYVSALAKLKFKCKNGHIWESNYKSVYNRGSWCPICCFNPSIYPQKGETFVQASLKHAANIAKKRGGKCLSMDAKTLGKLRWRCDQGHEWKATYANVINGSWCPTCKITISEYICKGYLEHLFGAKFLKMRPRWLKNPHGGLLELDGYCEELGVAFEHNGRQHYHQAWFQTEYEFTSLQKRDKVKKELCEQNGVKLIIIPAIAYMTEIEDLPKVIKEEFVRLNINNIKTFPPVKEAIDIDQYYMVNWDDYFEKIKSIMESHGWECLSKEYRGGLYKLKIKCNKGHVFDEFPCNIKKWKGCLECKKERNRESMLVKAYALAKNRGGECLSSEYKNNHSKMLWKCSCGNIWEASYNCIQRGTWCPPCSIIRRANKKRLGIDVYQKAAKKKGGKCLSKEVSSCFDEIEFECGQGHRWFARADQVKNTDSWCPKCNY